MKVLITGIGGAIGVHMWAHVMETTDWDVIGIDSYNHKGYFDRMTALGKEEWRERTQLIRHDLTAPLTDRQIEKIGDIDYVINLASLSDVQASIDDPVPFIRNNTELMLNMLEYARKAKPKAFVQFSTDETMGPVKVDRGHKEWSTILPSNPYAASKAAQEAIAISYWRSYGVPLIITNTMNNFSESQSPSKYPAMIQKKLEAGEKVTVHIASDGTLGTRYYIHSRAAADAVLFILKNTQPYLHKPGYIDRPDRYNIVGDKQVDNLAMAQTIAKLMGKELDYELVNFHDSNPGHDVAYGLDGTKLANLGWSSPMNFEESLQQAITWQKDHPEWLR